MCLRVMCVKSGQIVVYTGLLEMMKTDDMLAVILGHEMAHAIMGHMVRQVSIKSLAYVFMHARVHTHTHLFCPVQKLL